VGIVDEHRRTGAAGGDEFEPAPGTFEILERPQRHGHLPADRHRQAGGDEGVGNLEIADQRQEDLVLRPAGLTTSCCASPLRSR
jgi:hypothetical protein